MSRPNATYRLQFRGHMDFDRAAGLAPYLARLGVSHLYASPLFQAVPGSSHGYDVTDHGAFDESLGGMDGFLRLSRALKAAGLGLIVDIVPNHMAASPLNGWWRDVLRHGRESRYARHFDIDWSAPKLLVTVLGQPYGAALQAGEFALTHAPDGLLWRYGDHALPLDPRSWAMVFEAAEIDLPEGRCSQFWPQWIAQEGNIARLEMRLAALSRDRVLMHRIHEAQPWRLAYWRAARDMLTHRRFFEITDLVGVRVDDEVVFDDVHRLLFETIAAGHIDGLRIDHVDGLADPGGYLGQLKEKAPGHPPIWVEKILAADEDLPEPWPIEGTTGYEFARAVAALLTDGAGITSLDRIYAAFTGEKHDYVAMLKASKREILTRNLAAELRALTGLASAALAVDLTGRDWGPDSLRRGLVALALAMPVYRTYPESDPALLERIAGKAWELAELDEPAPVELLFDLMRHGTGGVAVRFRTRFQQTTGALMAKAVEDTLFYRFSRLISANEVGADPDHPTLDVASFHRDMEQRRTRQPGGLSATATHDTKRGEDARMRIAAIAEAPERWSAAVSRCDNIVAGGELVDAQVRWLFYQALLGAWETDEEDQPALTERMSVYMIKAAREAKRHTSWVRVDEAYEARLTGFVERALGHAAFRQAFAEATAPLIAMGRRKSLAQLALKLTAPGIPDIYQGTERADLSLVDPDNRREVDFALRMRALDGHAAGGFDAVKLALLRHGLALRRTEPRLFTEGDYARCRIEVAAPRRGLGFLRRHGGRVLAVAVELSGREGDGPVGTVLLDTGRLTPLFSWPADGISVVEAGLDLTRAFAEGPVAIALMVKE